jgi:16S rRNA (guanine(966)-N(2))-methyltransferase RsmD
MRIISGQYKGRRIKAPKGKKTRPTSDRVKEAIFNTLSPIIMECENFCDLFSGSGAIGIEALSRGVEKCDFVDNWLGAIKIIKENLLNLNDKEYKVIYKDVFQFINESKTIYDIVFLDPPYNMKNIDFLLEKVQKILLFDGIVVIETSTRVYLPDIIGNLNLVKYSIYGDTKITYYKKLKKGG